MKHCEHCNISFEAAVCPRCGGRGVSVADDSLDRMVQQASVPNLADLFKKAKKAGVITPAKEYGESN